MRANRTWMEPNQYWRRLFRIMFGFVVNLIGVWSKLAPFFNDLSAGYETEDLLRADG